MGSRRCTFFAVVLLVAAGCGSTADDSSPSPTSTTEPPATAASSTIVATAPTTSTAVTTTSLAAVTTRVGGAVPADGTVRCVAATFAYTIPRDWFAEASTALGAGPAPTSTTTTPPGTTDECSIVDHLDQAEWRLPTTRPGFFVASAYHADAYDIWLRTFAVGDDTGGVLDLAADIGSPVTVRLDGDRAVVEPGGAPVTATVVRNPAGLQGVRLAYTVNAAGPFAGDVTVGEQMVRIVVIRDGAPVLAVERVRSKYAGSPPDFAAAIDAIFATLTMSER